MTDKGRLGLAVQLKFMELHGRFPERHDEIDPNAAQWLAAQLRTTTEALSSYELAVAKGNGIGALSVLSLVSAAQPALTCNSLFSGYTTMYRRSTRKPAMAATWRSTYVARSAWNHPPAINLIASSGPHRMVTRRYSRRPFMRGWPLAGRESTGRQ